MHAHFWPCDTQHDDIQHSDTKHKYKRNDIDIGN
jgi:hypothetical protein